MAHFHIKTKKGRPYLYVREIARVDGKPKVISQIYIGSPEKVAGLLSGKEADLLNLKVEEFGSLWLAHLIDRDIDLCGIVDSVVPKAEREYYYIENVIISDVVASFFNGFCEFLPDLPTLIQTKFIDEKSSSVKDILFKIIYGIIRNNTSYLSLFGDPVSLDSIDLSDFDFSGLNLTNAIFKDCVALGTDFRKSDIRNAAFVNCILDQVTLDGSILTNCDFSKSEIVSIFVYDEYEKKTSAVIDDHDARQWLFTKGSIVKDQSSLNPLFGQSWYDAAREVTKTIEKRIAGSHQDVSLAKGTKSDQRDFAHAFVDFLKKKKILISIGKSDTGPGEVVKLDHAYRNDIVEFSKYGKISNNLAPFFKKYIHKDFHGKESIYFSQGIPVRSKP